MCVSVCVFTENYVTIRHWGEKLRIKCNWLNSELFKM